MDMKRVISQFLIVFSVFAITFNLQGQSQKIESEFGVTLGGFTNFPANKNYLKEDISAFYLAPYLRAGKHEFSGGIVLPLQTKSLYLTDSKIQPRLGFVAGYKYYIFNIYGRENLFIHYSFQYLRFKESYETHYIWSYEPSQSTETNMYINNVIGVGYNLFFDNDERFGFFYNLDYVISQSGYKLGVPGPNHYDWKTHFSWNHLSTSVGFSFKIAPLKKKAPK